VVVILCDIFDRQCLSSMLCLTPPTREIDTHANTSPFVVFFEILARLCTRCATVRAARGNVGVDGSSVCMLVLEKFSLDDMCQRTVSMTNLFVVIREHVCLWGGRRHDGGVVRVVCIRRRAGCAHTVLVPQSAPR
jgi:hypothetical protein